VRKGFARCYPKDKTNLTFLLLLKAEKRIRKWKKLLRIIREERDKEVFPNVFEIDALLL